MSAVNSQLSLVSCRWASGSSQLSMSVVISQLYAIIFLVSSVVSQLSLVLSACSGDKQGLVTSTPGPWSQQLSRLMGGQNRYNNSSLMVGGQDSYNNSILMVGGFV